MVEEEAELWETSWAQGSASRRSSCQALVTVAALPDPTAPTGHQEPARDVKSEWKEREINKKAERKEGQRKQCFPIIYYVSDTFTMCPIPSFI